MLPFFLPRQCVQLSSFFRKGFASLGFAVLSVGGWLHSLFHNSPSVLRGKCPCSFSSCFGSVPSGLAASGSNPNYPCSPEVEILLHNQPRELRVLQLRAHLGCLLEVSLERDGRMRREMGAVGVHGWLPWALARGIPGWKEKQEELPTKNFVSRCP